MKRQVEGEERREKKREGVEGRGRGRENRVGRRGKEG